jgi:hypothetical protein
MKNQEILDALICLANLALAADGKAMLDKPATKALRTRLATGNNDSSHWAVDLDVEFVMRCLDEVNLYPGAQSCLFLEEGLLWVRGACQVFRREFGDMLVSIRSPKTGGMLAPVADYMRISIPSAVEFANGPDAIWELVGRTEKFDPFTQSCTLESIARILPVQLRMQMQDNLQHLSLQCLIKRVKPTERVSMIAKRFLTGEESLELPRTTNKMVRYEAAKHVFQLAETGDESLKCLVIQTCGAAMPKHMVIDLMSHLSLKNFNEVFPQYAKTFEMTRSLARKLFDDILDAALSIDPVEGKPEWTNQRQIQSAIQSVSHIIASYLTLDERKKLAEQAYLIFPGEFDAFYRDQYLACLGSINCQACGWEGNADQLVEKPESKARMYCPVCGSLDALIQKKEQEVVA